MEWERASTDEIDQLIDQFASLSAAAVARLCSLIAEVDRRQSWMKDGARTLTDWVSARLRLRHSEARRITTLALRLADLPELGTRFSDGDLSLDQVEAIARMATQETESDLIEEALGLTNAALDLKARRTRPHSEVSPSDEIGRLYRQWNLDSSEMKFNGMMRGEAGRVLDSAIDEIVDQHPPNPETGMFDPYPVRAAEALLMLAGGGQVEAQITVFVSEDGVAELDNTAPISSAVLKRLACDATARPVSTTGHVGIGRRSRQIPGWLRELLDYRDGRSCQFPGCHLTRWLQAHHIQHWVDGGPTDLDNLILLCSYHHRFLHTNGWHITRGRDGAFQFRRTDWTVFPQPRQELAPRLRHLVRSP